jgi:hypothetical protein
VSRILKDPTIFKLRRTNIKPLLTEEGMVKRLEWCSQRARRQWSGNGSTVFCDLDESYFHCVTGAMLRVHVDSNTPIRHVRNYLHPPKVMVVVLVCAPNSRLGRSGKVGMWRVAEDEISKRSSSLRDANVIYKKDITMDSDVYFDLWTRVGGIADTLHQAFPNATTIYVQHDNAPAHVGKGVVDRILAEVNKNELAAKIIIESQPANSPDTNVCDLGLFRSMKTQVRKLRSVEKHRNYMLKQLNNNDDDNDNVEAEDENGNESKSSESDLPELKCGMKRLLSGKNERGAKCIECEQLVEDGREAIKCSVRGGWYHVDCLEARPSVGALNDDDEWWACPQCMLHGCATQGRGRAKAACVICNTRNGCRSCVAADVECEHWLQCTGRLGFYHMECVDVGEDGDDEDWVCRLCKVMPAPIPEYEVAVPTRFPPDGVPLYKCVDIWLDNADSMFGAIELAWEKYDSSKLARLYETKPVVLAEIVRDNGGNRYRLPHWRDNE